MTMQGGFQPPSLIGATNATVNTGTNPFLDRLTAARAAGPVMAYDFKSLKPKKQLKEIIKVLKPERKRFLKMQKFKI